MYTVYRSDSIVLVCPPLTFVLLFLLYIPDETQATIAKHVLKTVCTDATNVLLSLVAAEHMTSDSSTAITSEVQPTAVP